MSDSADDYEVGFKKPPKHTRFKPGRSGNPRGRPKGHRNFSKVVKDMLKEPVRLTKEGKPKTVSTQVAALLRLREKALKGDSRALDRLLELARTFNDDEITEAAAKLERTDAEVLEAYQQRMLRRAGTTPPEDNDEAPEDQTQPGDAATDGDDAPEEEDDDDAWLR